MRVAVSGLALRPRESLNCLLALAAERVGVDPGQVRSWRLLRRSLDARGRREPRFVCTVGLDIGGETIVPKRPEVSEWKGSFWVLRMPASAPPNRPIVVGLGPAGLFAALRLCAYGLRPVIFERGAPVEERVKDVARYWRRGELDPESNVQFGEGGAGTFSDGKLTYRGKDDRKTWVFQKLVEAGAPPEVRYDARPHLGTDRLRAIVMRLRTALLAAGAEIFFRARIERLLIEESRCAGVVHTQGESRGSPVFLAPGHSARDLYRGLASQGVALEPKGFAAGVRVEVAQGAVDARQYGRWAGEEGLPSAEFTIKAQTPSGRDVYSFCMCPGGVVIPAGTEGDGTVVNGMSSSGRKGPRANAALVVAVGPADCGDGARAGLDWQREVEARAHRLAGERGVPGQRVTDFLTGRKSSSLPRSSCPWPVVSASLDECFPPFVGVSLREALPSLIRQLPPLAEGLLIGVETRTSSPVRVPRGEDLESVNVGDLYPIGEGAGYAGGIVSAAVDGIRAADAYAARLGGGPIPGVEPMGG